jgi:hypothetical protein
LVIKGRPLPGAKELAPCFFAATNSYLKYFLAIERGVHSLTGNFLKVNDEAAFVRLRI